MKQLYVCSRSIVGEDGTRHRHLLGILSQNDDKRFSFEYRLGKECSNSSLLLPIFPDGEKKYSDHDVRLLLDDYLPSENDTAFIRQILKQTKMQKYDEWAWITAFESSDDNSETKLYETLPDDIIIHDDEIKRLLKIQDESLTDICIAENKPSYDKTDEISEQHEPVYEQTNETITSDTIFDAKATDDLLTDIEDETQIDFNYLFDNYDVDMRQNETNDDEFVFDDTIIQSRQPNKPSEINNKPSIKIKKITTIKKVKISQTNSFAIPPLTNPCDIIQQRLEQTIKDHKERLKRENITND